MDNSEDQAPAGTAGTGEDVCRRCGGSGRIESAPCSDCGGSGRMVKASGGG